MTKLPLGFYIRKLRVGDVKETWTQKLKLGVFSTYIVATEGVVLKRLELGEVRKLLLNVERRSLEQGKRLRLLPLLAERLRPGVEILREVSCVCYRCSL